MTEEKESSGDRIREAYQDLAKLRQQGDPGSLTLVIGIILLLMPFLSYPFISGGSSCTGYCGFAVVFYMLGAMAIFGMISLIFFSISRSQSSKYNTEKKEIVSQLIELAKVPEDKLKPLISQASRENYVIKYADTKHPQLKEISKHTTPSQTDD
ncbi:MAG: hypothetical protein CMB57_04510 [Euryarchaeota archaeon]|nr:hypothetical protein [Euryarchaeota archaeon]